MNYIFLIRFLFCFYNFRFFFSRSISNLIFCLTYGADFYQHISPNSRKFRNTWFLACKSSKYLILNVNATNLILTIIVWDWLHYLRAGLKTPRYFLSRHPKFACTFAFLLPALINFPANFAYKWSEDGYGEFLIFQIET